jgi:cellulose synthase/poly-beta-1,6-N-acetylglucosamine synthase-like glycosyltransferase
MDLLTNSIASIFMTIDSIFIFDKLDILLVLHTITDFIRMTAVIYLITDLLLYFKYCWKFMCDIHTKIHCTIIFRLILSV